MNPAIIGGATIHHGDVREVLATLPEQSAQTCVTSPPYWGLRDYGVEGQLGLEATPDEYIANMVAVFREVRRVLRDDGTCWINIGDSYAGSWGAQSREHAGKHAPNVSAISANQVKASQKRAGTGSLSRTPSMKSKDLVGIPWMLAFALRQPYYTGAIKDERDRIWLAAMVDAEGSVCGTEYLTGDRTKTNLYISVTNTSAAIIEKCERLFPQNVKHVYEKSGPSSRVCYRWDVERMETKALFIREIYPYLVAKKKQAIVGYTFLEIQKGLLSKKKGYLPEQHEQRSWLMASLSRLNAGEDVDLPDWVVEPPSLNEPGFYLRQDVIWAKPNPMPESVRDRCTKAHEYIFLLSKSERYHFDAEAIKEAATNANLHAIGTVDTRNKRSVWTVASKPFSEAHFATFPPKLIEPCIMAGAPAGGVVLDPFHGAGTTGMVALQNGRHYVGIELNAEYIAMSVPRIEAASRQSRMFA